MSLALSALPTAILFLVAVGISVTLALGGLLVVRRSVHHTYLSEHNDVAGFIFAILGVTYAVVLAFVGIAEWETFSAVETAVQREAAITLNLYDQAAGFSEPGRSQLEEAAKTYAHLVATEEWRLLAEGRWSAEVSSHLSSMWDTVQSIEPRTQSELVWYEQVIVSLKELTKHREERIIAAKTQLQPMLWLVLLVGGFITIGYTYLYGVKNAIGQIIMVAAMASMIGLVIAMIIALDHPFTGPTSVTAEAFETAVQEMGASRRN